MAEELRQRVPLLLQAGMVGAAAVAQTAIGRGIVALFADDPLRLDLPLGFIFAVVVTGLLSPVVGLVIQASLDRVGVGWAGVLAGLAFGATLVGLFGSWITLFWLLGIGTLSVSLYTLALGLLVFVTALRRASWGEASRKGALALAGLAVIIGGSKRAWRAKEFIANLHFGPGDGRVPKPHELLAHAAGLVIGAIKVRARDAARPGVKILDWILVAPRTEFLIAIVTVLGASYYARNGRGWDGVMSNMENISAIALLVAAVLLWLRTRRRPPGSGDPDER
ncbi:hypothetical protein [Thermoactinospora rubra]|uniref:hypothetical protein n=1 Tax=Thermoactinospora rubra TaxID=1088767 RepID=UPI000A10BF1F|nr:hypothetical protein [Thermoactinospora rubra]